jgi:hypothetical protein
MSVIEERTQDVGRFHSFRPKPSRIHYQHLIRFFRLLQLSGIRYRHAEHSASAIRLIQQRIDVLSNDMR